MSVAKETKARGQCWGDVVLEKGLLSKELKNQQSEEERSSKGNSAKCLSKALRMFIGQLKSTCQLPLFSGSVT